MKVSKFEGNFWANDEIKNTVMIRFSALGAYSRQGAYSGQEVYFFFLETTKSSKENAANIYLKRNNNRNCKSNKYMHSERSYIDK